MVKKKAKKKGRECRVSKDSPIDRYRKPVRKQGRPMFSNVYSGKCDVRLDKQELEMLDHLSDLNGVTKSDVMRRALRDYYRFNTDKSED